jgi:ABC-type amino acid transport system permease subunit
MSKPPNFSIAQVALIYLCMVLTLSGLLSLLERRLRKGDTR